MANQNIQIKQVSVGNLYQFADEVIGNAKQGDFIPITLHRAQAMSKNPYAEARDVALLVACSGAEIIGYFGIMTVKFQHGGKLHKAYWFTTWSVSAKFVGHGVGSKLMQAALNLEQDYFIVGSKPARRVCDKFGFKRLPAHEFTVIDFRVVYRYNPVSLFFRALRKAAMKLDLQFNLLKAISLPAGWLERAFGPLFQPVLYQLLLPIAKKGLPQYKFEYVDQVNSGEHADKLDQNITRLYRGDEIVNWMLSEPWALRPGQSKSEQLEYNFSDTRALFEIFAINIYTDDYRGYVAYQFSKIGENRVLKVLDAHMDSDEAQALILAATLQIAHEKKADLIEIESVYVQGISTSALGKILITYKQRICQVHPHSDDSPLGQAWSEISMSLVDGDTAFS